MKRAKFSHKVIAVFLILNFLTTIIPVNYLFANNNGPGSPEAAGFEPVDATDMVSLTTGDLSYVLPLLDVEGFPISLSYHAGMTSDMDASWVGLGWYLNPGAINRSVTNTPDDWKSGVGINYTSYQDETDYYGITVEFGFPVGASVGVGLNWGGGKGLSGSVFASTHTFKMGDIKAGASASGSVSTTGDASLGIGYGAQIGSFGVGASLSYSLKNQWSLSGGAGYKVSDNTFIGMGASTSGGFGIGASAGETKKGVQGSAGGGMSSNSFSSGDASVDVQSTGIALPLHALGIPITLGFSKTKVKINIRKGFYNQEWGALYSSDFYNLESGTPQINVVNPNTGFSDYAVRTKSMDIYSTRLPQPEEQFIGDYSKEIENINFTFMGYDDYNVAAQGVMGSLTPNLFKNATIFGKGESTKNANNDDIHVFWHHGDTDNASNRKFGRLDETSTLYNNNDLYFYLNGQFTSNETTNPGTLSTSSISTATNINDLIYEGSHSGFSNSNSNYGRAKSPNFVEVFTNEQIANGHAALSDLISPATIPNSDRNDISKFDPNGIGAYKITTPDGKTYHFALPVYHFEQIHRGQINTQEDGSFNIANVTEKRQYSRYATHWLLTAITGSDYIDANNNGQFDKTDYGYWVELEYGKWSDGYVWRTPYRDRSYTYNTDIKGNIGTKDKGGYVFGRKQIYYLDKINTKNRTALFVKDIRYDAVGKDLKFQYSNSTTLSSPFGSPTFVGDKTLGNTGDGGNQSSLKYTEGSIDVREYANHPNGGVGVKYKQEYTLKLTKIVLVDGDVGKTLSKSNSGNLGSLYSGYTPNDNCFPNWESQYFKLIYWPNLSTPYSYSIHNENKVLDVNDVSQAFIKNNALKVIELNHSYKLAKNSPSSSPAINTGKNDSLAKLTLNSVQIKGKGGTAYMPATSFNYYLENEPNIDFDPTNTDPAGLKAYVEAKKNFVDSWGYLQGNTTSGENKIKAWSLKDITLPTGAKIEIDYEEDDYWMEAFARRFWEDGLRFDINSVDSQKFDIIITKDINSTDQNFYFDDYFKTSEDTYFDLWLCTIDEDYNFGCNVKRNKINIIGDFPVKPYSVTSTQLVFRLNKSQYIEQLENSEDIYSPTFTTYSGFGDYLSGPRGSCPNPSGCGDGFNIVYRLLANKVPENETGGGIRVKELRTKDLDNTYKVTYDYNHPTQNRSSGITSYAPIDGLKYVPYQSEIPSPGVMYEYVTMSETSSTGDFDSKTRYRHHVLKPVYNIFNPNIEMQALDANAEGEDKIFWANVTEDFGGFNGNNAKNIEAKKLEVNINTALIGQIKSIENLNSVGQVMFKTENEYINGTILNNKEPNKGYVKETFNAMKTVFQTNPDGTIIEGQKRLLSISSKATYNNMLKKSITYAGGQKSYVEYSDVDPWLSSFRKSETTMADGTKTQSIRYPAYEKYSGMQSKVLNPANKNMLTQEAMNITNVEIEGQWKTVNANVTTWKDTWDHVDNNGQTNTLGGLWRKHQSFVWKDAVDAKGTYGRSISPYDFNWGVGTAQTNTQWQKVSEITKYTLWSSPVETMDINGNFAASKMADNFSKTIASGNSRYTEMYYSGAEHVENGNMFDGEVLGANYRTNEEAHTGSWSVKNVNTSNKVFEINKSVNSSVSVNAIRPGNYRVSFWAKENNAVNNAGITLTVNGNVQTVSETVEAGCWKQYNYTITVSGTNLNLDVKATGTVDNYFDDFRMHPIASTMNSYVYNQSTDELIAILGANNMASVYCYDAAGRLCTTYTEVANQENNIGGFKVTNKNKYNYKGNQNSYAGCDCIVDYCNDNDIDKDGVLNQNDNCPNDYNPDQADTDNDGKGNVCDPDYGNDADNDGILNVNDNCPNNYNPDQADADNDGIGNVCDPDYGNTFSAVEDSYQLPVAIGNSTHQFTLHVLSNDIISNPSGGILTILFPPLSGTAVVDNKGTTTITDDVIIYTIQQPVNVQEYLYLIGNNHPGQPYSFIYQINDSFGNSSSASVNISFESQGGQQ